MELSWNPGSNKDVDPPDNLTIADMRELKPEDANQVMKGLNKQGIQDLIAERLRQLHLSKKS